MSAGDVDLIRTHLLSQPVWDEQVLAALERIEDEAEQLKQRCEDYRAEREAERDAKEALQRRLNEAAATPVNEALRRGIAQARRVERERAKQAVRLTFSDSNNCERCLQEAANAIDALGDE